MDSISSAAAHPDSADEPWTDSLLDQHIAQLANGWRRPDGIFATVYKNGTCIDDTPLVADLGDTAPFLLHFNRRDAAMEQALLARSYLWRGLFEWDGRVRLFENHDFLLGLLELYPATREQWLVDLARTAVATLVRDFEFRGILVDEIVGGARSRFPLANSFNGGYIELCVDLHKITKEEEYLEIAKRWAHAWIATPLFRRHGLFARFNTPLVPAVGYAYGWISRYGPIRLFKDNTNPMWSLAALYRETGETWLADALRRFLDGFERRVWNRGAVRQYLARPFDGFDLAAATFSLDMLCDLTELGIDPERTLHLAESIAAACEQRRWACGLVPVGDQADRDHLDIMIDLGVALWKLGELSGEQQHKVAAWRGWRATLQAHATPHGFILAVGSQGQPRDERVIVKYQALLLKSALLRDLTTSIYEDRALWSLLRDR